MKAQSAEHWTLEAENVRIRCSLGKRVLWGPNVCKIRNGCNVLQTTPLGLPKRGSRRELKLSWDQRSKLEAAC